VCIFAGGMAGRRAEEVHAERQAAIKAFSKVGIFAVDPAAAEQKFIENQKSKKINVAYSEKVMKAFVTQDKWLIRHSDALLVMTGDRPSDGTWREMCYAEAIGIPVVMIAPQRKKKEMVGWSNILVPHIVKDLSEAVNLIKRRWVKEYTAHRQYFELAIRKVKESTRKKKQKQRQTKII
jgi:nucleoside 2-deoxyribosyltransferase